jgi:hypothetical protein
MRHLIYVAPGTPSAISGAIREIQPHQQLIGAFVRVLPPPAARKALTLQTAPSIRPALAAGAILPPLFFERRRAMWAYLLRQRHPLENTLKTTPASITRLNGWGPRPDHFVTAQG